MWLCIVVKQHMQKLLCFFQTSFNLPLVKEGDRTLRILLQSSSSTIDTASYSGPFRRKFCTQTNKQTLLLHRLLLNVRYQYHLWCWFYPSVGEERVTFFHQDGFEDGQIQNTQNRLPRIINSVKKRIRNICVDVCSWCLETILHVKWLVWWMSCVNLTPRLSHTS